MFSDMRRDALYQSWQHSNRKGHLGTEWSGDFNAFCTWAMANGYEIGKQILRIDRTKPRGPENCYVCTLGVDSKTVENNKARAKSYDQSVEQFRQALRRSTPETRSKTIRLVESGRLWYGYSNNYSSAKNGS